MWGFRVLGALGLGFRSVGVRVLGHWSLGFRVEWILGFRFFRVLGDLGFLGFSRCRGFGV